MSWVDMKAGCWVERWVASTAVTLVAMTAVTTAVKMALLMVERKAARKVGYWVDQRDQPKAVL